MDAELQIIIQKVVLRPETDRVEVISALQETLRSSSLNEVEQAWLPIIEERMESLRNGTAKLGYPDVLREFREKQRVA